MENTFNLFPFPQTRERNTSHTTTKATPLNLKEFIQSNVKAQYWIELFQGFSGASNNM